MTLAPVALAVVLAQAPAYVEPPPSPSRASDSPTPTPTPTSTTPTSTPTGAVPPPAASRGEGRGGGSHAPADPTPTPTSTPTGAVPPPPASRGEGERGASAARPDAARPEPVVPPTPPPADLPPPPPATIPPPPGPGPATADGRAPPSSRYLVFQVAIAAPAGDAAARVPQEAVYGVMVELELQAGTKTSASTLAGGYFGFGIGGVGTRAQRLCNAAQEADCSTMMARAGGFLRLGPQKQVGSEPWALLGLGARVDSSDVPDVHGTEHARLAYGGEARLSVGLDFPPSRTAALGDALGLGLYLDATLFQALGSDAIPELGVAGGRRRMVGWVGGGLRLIQR